MPNPDPMSAERLAEITRAAVVAGGLELFAPESPAAAMTAVRAPAGVSATEIVKRLKAEFGGIVSDGQGEMKGSMFRIAHLGYFDYLDTLGLLGALEQVLVALAPGKFELGKMVGAAQRSLVSGRDSAPGVQDEA